MKGKRLKNILFTVLIAFAIISFWRGIWGLMDVYLLPGNYPLSLLTSVLIGLAILVATHKTVEKLI